MSANPRKVRRAQYQNENACLRMCKSLYQTTDRIHTCHESLVKPIAREVQQTVPRAELMSKKKISKDDAFLIVLNCFEFTAKTRISSR